MKILISAAEASSDLHGAELVRALKAELAERGEALEVFGLGGPHLVAAGLEQLVDSRKLLAMGFTEVLRHLPEVARALKCLTRSALERKPDIAVVLDYPDFHFRLVQRLAEVGACPVVYYIPPKVWAWRKGRVKFLRHWFAQVLCIFPFEQDFFVKNGVSCTYVGNPLLDELPLELKKAQARSELGLRHTTGVKEKVLLLMPGSRPSEVKRHLFLMLDAAVEISKEIHRLGQRGELPLQVLMPFPATADMSSIGLAVDEWKALSGKHSPSRKVFEEIELHLFQGRSAQCMVAADVGLVKSGTSTLEAALLGCAHAVVFKTGKLSEWIFKLFIRYKGAVGLVNLVSGEDLAKEILLDQVTVESLTKEGVRLFVDGEARKHFSEKAHALREKLKSPSGLMPARAAAQEILKWKGKTHRPILRRLNVAVRLGSLLWSAVNWAVRMSCKWGLLKPKRLPVKRVVSVGNLQVGGAGKTPLVAEIAKQAFASGKTVAILTRGYGGAWAKKGETHPVAPGDEIISPTLCGDEAALLHELVPQAWLGVGPDRAQAYEKVRALAADEHVIIDLVILDDGLQHWKLHRDVDVVATTHLEWGDVLYRDFPRMSENSLAVWTKGASPCTAWVGAKNTSRVRFCLPSAYGTHVLLVSGVADPESLLATVQSAGYVVVEERRFPDHHVYSKSEIDELLMHAKHKQVQVALTGKDWVKWKSLGVEAGAVLVLEPALEFLSGRDEWNHALWG